MVGVLNGRVMCVQIVDCVRRFVCLFVVFVVFCVFFFFNDTATTEIYTLSLHDALPILVEGLGAHVTEVTGPFRPEGGAYGTGRVMGHSHEH